MHGRGQHHNHAYMKQLSGFDEIHRLVDLTFSDFCLHLMGHSSVFILQRLGDRSQLLGFLVMPIVGLYLGIMAQSLS